MELGRRRFLGWITAASGVALVGCDDDGAPPAAGPDADPTAPDGAPGEACTPTTGDALGPFHEPGAPNRSVLAGPGEPGERLVITGTVVDDACAPIAGALLDVWQADATGAYHEPGKDYRLRGQMMTGADGAFRIETIRPGNYEQAPGAWRPAHLHMIVSRPGHASVTTQLYFAGDPFLPPNDSCTTCGSDDPARIIALAGDAQAGWEGAVELVLGRTA